MVRVLAVFAVLCAVSPGYALIVTDAKIARGAVQVKGKAVPFAGITFDGARVTTAGKSGAFKFRSDVLPADCVGEVSDGSDSVGAVIAGCTRAGGGLAVKDATGTTIGSYFLDTEGSAFTTDAVILRSVDGPVVAPLAGPTGFGGFGLRSFFFESADCSAQPLLGVVANPTAPLRAHTVIDGFLYYPRRSGMALTVRSRERRTVGPDCGGPEVFIPPDRCCCPSPGCMTPSGLTAASPGSMDVRSFVPPFRVEFP